MIPSTQLPGSSSECVTLLAGIRERVDREAIVMPVRLDGEGSDRLPPPSPARARVLLWRCAGWH